MEQGVKLQKDLTNAAWMEREEVFEMLHTSKSGLKREEVQARKREEREGRRKKKKEDTVQYRIRRAFFNPFTSILIFLCIVSFVTNHWMQPEDQRSPYSAWILLVMVLISGGIRLSQEMKSRHASEQMERLIHMNVQIRRDGVLAEVPARELVPGDCVCLSAGSRIPADLRLTESTDLFVSQAAVSGESAIVEKTWKAYTGEKKSSAIHYPNLVFMGTTVISGRGEGIVLASGNNTLYGKAYTERMQRPGGFEQGANSIAKVMLKFMAVLVPVVFIISGLTKGNWMEAFLFGVSVAVGLMPEMLPMVVTACLAKGSMTLSARKTLIKDMDSMQGFGSMDILCADKTGTLTNETILLEYYMDVLGNESEEVLDLAYLNSLHHSGIHNTVDEAILKCREMPGKESYYRELGMRYRKEDELPFDYERKCVSVLVSDENNVRELILKGEPDAVLERCSAVFYGGQVLPIEEDGRSSMEAVIDEMLEDGMKVIAVARKSAGHESEITLAQEFGMVLMGYLAFFDAPKKSAAEAVQKLKELQVRTKILTGDKKSAAQSVCRRVGMDCTRVLTGAEMEELDDERLQTAVEYAEVFAELTPNQKVRIIEILKENGHTVGFLGDGMNDVPALCEADVGISVDTAVDAAKDAAHVVLLEKDLNILEEGILEGRKTFFNMSKYIRITASSNFGNIFSIVCAGAFLPFLPMTAIQILLLNLLYDILCIVLPWDRVDAKDCRTPREWSGRTLGRFMWWFGPISSLFDIVTFLFLYFILCPAMCGGATFTELSDPDLAVRYIAAFQTGWFLESMWSQVLILHMLRTSGIPFAESRPSRSVAVITLLGVVLFSCMTASPLGGFLGLTVLPAQYFVFLIAVVCGYMILTSRIKQRYVKKFREWI